MTTVHEAMSCPSSVLHFVVESSQYPMLVAHCLSDIQQGADLMNAIPQYIHMPLQGSHPCSLHHPDWPVLALSVVQSGMILLNFTIQLLILSRRLRSTSLCVARRLSSLETPPRVDSI